jgi:MFS family permease
MSKTQFMALCVCNIVLFTGLAGLIGLMPLYLADLGADSSLTGFFMAFAYLSLAVSTISSGRLADRFGQRRTLLIIFGGLAVPVTLALSAITSVPLLMALMAVLWFVTGFAMTMVNVIAGLYSEPGSRGRIFGILSLSVGIGLAFGSWVSGRIVDAWGYPALFQLQGLFYIVVPLAALLVKDKTVIRVQGSIPVREIFAQRSFLFLFLANVIGQGANSVIFLTRPMIMDAMHFDASAISSAPAFGSLVTLPLPLFIGWLADRAGRRAIIIICFALTSVSFLMMIAAVDLWHFWLASALQSIMGMSMVVGSALTTDMFPEESLGTSLSLLSSTPWIGIVFGFSLGGIAVEAIQIMPTLAVTLALSVVATLLLIPVNPPKTPAQAG